MNLLIHQCLGHISEKYFKVYVLDEECVDSFQPRECIMYNIKNNCTMVYCIDNL